MWRGFSTVYLPPDCTAQSPSLSLSLCQNFCPREIGRYREQHRLFRRAPPLPRLIDVNVWLAMRRKEGGRSDDIMLHRQHFWFRTLLAGMFDVILQL